MSIIHLFSVCEKTTWADCFVSCVRGFQWKPITSAALQSTISALSRCHFQHRQRTKKKKKKARTDSFSNQCSWSSATTHLGLQDNIDIRRAHTCHRRHGEHIQRDPRAPRTHTASSVHTDVCVSELFAGSYRGQANPAPVFSAVKQLEARKLLTSSGENVFWQAPSSSFTLYLAAAHSAPPPLTRSTWQPPPHAFTPPLTSTHTCAYANMCVCAQALLLLLLYICAEGKNQATQQERAGVIQGIIYVENHDAGEAFQKLSSCNQISVMCCADQLKKVEFLWIADHAESL